MRRAPSLRRSVRTSVPVGRGTMRIPVVDWLMAGSSSASWAIWCARNGCITKDTPPPFTSPNTTFGYTPLRRWPGPDVAAAAGDPHGLVSRDPGPGAEQCGAARRRDRLAGRGQDLLVVV